MTGDDFHLGDFIERTLAVDDPQAVVSELKRGLAHWGFDYIACGTFGGEEACALPMVVDYPSVWQQHYFERNYIAIDPVVNRAAQARRPYRWDELGELSAVQRRMFAEAGEAGLHDGLTVPLHSPGGEVFVASVASAHGDTDRRRGPALVNLLVTQAHSVLVGLRHPGAPAAPVQLTARERECLIWSARGKSSWDIGMILSISENTVNFHLKNAMAKLQASTRVMAIVKAIRIGLIVP